MRQIQTTVIALTGLVMLTAAGASGSEQLQGPGIIRITNQEVKRTLVDVGKRGRTAGDTEIFRQLLYNRRITPKSIGHSELVCTYTTDTSRYCSGTYFLPRGRIVVGGVIRFRQFYELAVLGGTGLYNNVKGSLTVTSTARRPPTDLLLFRLVV
jgi:hypothetical protein